MTHNFSKKNVVTFKSFNLWLRRLFKPPLTLFWRLFLSLLAMLLITSALSVSIERWINARLIEDHIEQQSERLIAVRGQLVPFLEQDNLDSIRQLYRQDRRLMGQILILNGQGQIIFPRSGRHDRTRPRPINDHRDKDRERRHSSHPQSQQQPQQQINNLTGRTDQFSMDVAEYPQLADITVTSVNGQTYTLKFQPRLPLQDLMASNKRYTFIRVALIILFSILVCYWLSRALTRRIRQLQLAVRQLSKGDYHQRGDAERLINLGNDELGQLAQDVSQLSARLADSELARKQMLSDISHELRSPLARLNVATELTRDFAPNATTYLDRIEKESARMNELIEQIIRIQSLQMERYSGNLADSNTADFEPISITQLLDEICEDVCFEFYDKKINLKWQNPLAVDSNTMSPIGKNAPIATMGDVDKTDSYQTKAVSQTALAWTVIGDKDNLYSALENIVRNAFIHTPPRSEVEITLKQTTLANKHPAVQIQISDTGYGVAKSDLERIFQPFVRVSQSRERVDYTSAISSNIDEVSTNASSTEQTPAKQPSNHKTRGYGLGLAIAHAVIQAHQGQLTAHNRTDLPSGLVVTVILPKDTTAL